MDDKELAVLYQGPPQKRLRFEKRTETVKQIAPDGTEDVRTTVVETTVIDTEFPWHNEYEVLKL
jgi:hypothetical protein